MSALWDFVLDIKALLYFGLNSGCVWIVRFINQGETLLAFVRYTSQQTLIRCRSNQIASDWLEPKAVLWRDFITSTEVLPTPSKLKIEITEHAKCLRLDCNIPSFLTIYPAKTHRSELPRVRIAWLFWGPSGKYYLSVSLNQLWWILRNRETA